jgi:primosomal protein N' (replication factor Y)
MKNLRLGVTRASEELEALMNEPVTQVTKETSTVDFRKSRIYLGTEAVLHRIDWADLIVFADFDQELLAKRYRCEEQALAKLVKAIRLVHHRNDHSGSVIVQSRQPNNDLFKLISEGDLEVWCDKESRRREIIKYPPFGHIAVLSGPGSHQFVEDLRSQKSLEILGPNQDVWLVKSPRIEELSEGLSKVRRPKERLRIAIDPVRF